MKNILVTGGAGYVGSILCTKLSESGYNVLILDKLLYTDSGIRDLLGKKNVSLVEGDIRNKDLLKSLLKNIDHIIHLAAIANDPSGELNPELTREINFSIYEYFLEEARRSGVSTFINASTFGVYGKKDNINITEEEPLYPLKEYSICKANSEEIVKGYNSDDFATISLRCSTICGWSPRMRFDLIVNTLTGYAIANRKLDVWGGEQKRPQIHIDDITTYFVKILEMPKKKIGGKIYNAGGQNVTILDIANTIKQALPFKIDIELFPPRDDERSYHVSSGKIKDELGLEPEKTIKDAIIDIYDAYNRGLWKDPDDMLYHNIKRMKYLDFT
jgi:nucleoside-diphosphate-sugar epimerase